MFGHLKRKRRPKDRAAATAPPDELMGRLVTSVDFCVLDCEMTGLDVARDEIISIGAVKIRDGVVVLDDSFYRVIRPKQTEMTRENVLIHRLTHDQVAEGESAERVMDEFQTFIQGSVLVGHFIAIDLGFLNRLNSTLGRERPLQPACDTRYIHEWYLDHVIRQEVREPNELRLPSICRRMNVPCFQEHHAFYDALSTAALFLKQLDILAQEDKYTLADVFKIGREQLA